MTPAVQDAIDLLKIVGGAVGGGAFLRLLQLRSTNRLTDAKADREEAEADATESEATVKLIQAATGAVEVTGPFLMSQLQAIQAANERQAAELQEVRTEVWRLMGQATEDRVQILTLTAELERERARNTRTDTYLAALREWAADAVREIRRLDGTISDPPTPPLDPPSPSLPAPRRPSD